MGNYSPMQWHHLQSSYQNQRVSINQPGYDWTLATAITDYPHNNSLHKNEGSPKTQLDHNCNNIIAE